MSVSCPWHDVAIGPYGPSKERHERQTQRSAADAGRRAAAAEGDNIMNVFFAMTVVLALLLWTGLFFFVVTRGALLVRALSPKSRNHASHVYPVYSNMRLIRLVDCQPVISAILLFQYHRLVSTI